MQKQVGSLQHTGIWYCIAETTNAELTGASAIQYQAAVKIIT